MNEMMSYVFGTLQRNEATLEKLLKVVGKQASNMGLLTAATIGYVVLSERKRKEQDKKIRQLREDIDALINKDAGVNEP